MKTAINLSFALGAYRGTFDIHQLSYASALVALGGKVVYSLVLAAAFTRGGLSRHHQDMVMFHGEVPSPGAAVCIGLATQAKPAGFASKLHTFPFGLNPGDATRSLIGRCVLTTPHLLDHFEGAQSTAQLLHTDPRINVKAD